jgi:hypothetical protein
MARAGFLGTARLAALSVIATLAVATTIAGAATTAAPKNGRYSGKNAQGLAVSFRVRGKVVSGVRFALKYPSGCEFHVGTSSALGQVRSTGTFKVAETQFAGFRWTLTGRFVTSTRAVGKVSARDACPAEAAVGYTARRVG